MKFKRHQEINRSSNKNNKFRNGFTDTALKLKLTTQSLEVKIYGCWDKYL